MKKHRKTCSQDKGRYRQTKQKILMGACAPLLSFQRLAIFVVILV
jgi:hypothetical protein